MKGESDRRRGAISIDDADAIAVEVLARIASDPERISRFLSLTGLDPARLRDAAGEPGFLSAVLDHVAADESLLVAIAGEIGGPPERLVAAQRLLSPERYEEI